MRRSGTTATNRHPKPRSPAEAVLGWPTEGPPLVILRDGGAPNELAWLNDCELARFVCLSLVPVLTRVGHERVRRATRSAWLCVTVLSR